MNISDIKSTYRIEEVIHHHLPGGLKPQGPERVGNCIFHDDSHASLKVNPSKQIFKCFACGEGGDIFDFFTLQGQTIPEAKVSITNGAVSSYAANYEPKPVEVVWTNAIPDQSKLPDVANLNFKDYGKPSRYWAYTNAIGYVIGYVLRFDLPDGKKDVIPYSYKSNGKISKWQWRGLDLPRPLFNLHKIFSRPNDPILMVEGEKTAEAAEKLFPQFVCSTWIGGGENIKNADLTPLQGRNVYAWPDNDVPGVHCMFGGWQLNEKTEKYRRIKGLVELVDANFKRINNQPSFAKKWDVADADWTPEEAYKYLKANRDVLPEISEHAPNEIPVVEIEVKADEMTHVVPAPATPVPVPIPEKPVTPRYEDTVPKNSYFKCLGFENNDQNLFVFFVYRTNVIVKLTAGGISTANLLQLAPLNYWENNYPKAARSGPKFEINTIADHLISICSRIGIFSANKIRGRGAWHDEGRVVLHLGDTLIVDGAYTDFSMHNSRFIYEAGQELGFKMSAPLKKQDAFQLLELLKRLHWERPIAPYLLAGWITIAPLCGALKWRPHMWLTGASGTGKSWIMNHIIKIMLAEMFLDVQSSTTEAGIRQFLGPDALPVTFDEIESENKNDLERVQSILNIVRASSTSDSGKIIKGSSGGNATVFDIRSCFVFSSIGANLTQRSDISRVTVLELKDDKSSDKREKWHETLSIHNSLISEEYVQAFQSRAISMLPTILKNAKTFSNAAASELDNERTGDQLGALLAGAFSLTSDAVISFDDAKKWIKERDWSEERMSDSTRDEVKVLHKIVSAEIQVETNGFGRLTRTVGELIMTARNDVMPEQDSMITEELAKATLKRSGIRVEGFSVIISSTSDFIARIVPPAYSKNYHTILARIDGAEKVEGITFGSYMQTSATKIDSHRIFGKVENPGLSATEKELHSPKQKPEDTQGNLFEKKQL